MKLKSEGWRPPGTQKYLLLLALALLAAGAH